MSFPGFTLVIATCGRPDRLEHALGHVARAMRACPGTHRLVLADNHPSYTARPVVERMRGQLGVEVTYLQTPPRNKCAALNAALREIPGGWIAFTDDDTEPQEGWLCAGRTFIESADYASPIEERERMIGQNPMWEGHSVPRQGWLGEERVAAGDCASHIEEGKERVAAGDCASHIEEGKERVAAGDCRIFGGRVDVGRVEEPVPWHLKEKGAVRMGGGGGIFVRYAPLTQSGVLGATTQVPLGANLFVRKDVFDQYGGYNEALWEFLGSKALGVDDGEFGIRLQKAGERFGYCQEAVVVHPCYAEKYAFRRRVRNVYAYGWRNPILLPEDYHGRFPFFAVRAGLREFAQGVAHFAGGRAASGMNAILQGVRQSGVVASCFAGAPQKAAGLVGRRFGVAHRAAQERQ